MALTKTQKDMQKCIPFVKAFSQKDIDKESWREVLMAENLSFLLSLLAVLEIGRDNFFTDTFTPKSNPETFFSRHRNATERQQAYATKEVLVGFILNKLLLHKYMQTAYTVLSLKKLDTNDDSNIPTDDREVMNP